MFKIGKFLGFTPSSTSNRNPSVLQKTYELSLYVVYFILWSLKLYYYFAGFSSQRIFHYILILLLCLSTGSYSFYVSIVVMRLRRLKWFQLIDTLNLIPSKNNPSVDYAIIAVSFTLYLTFLIPPFVFQASTLNSKLLIVMISKATIFLVEYFYGVLGVILVVQLKLVKSNLLILKAAVDIFNDIFGGIILLEIFVTSFRILLQIDHVFKGGKTRASVHGAEDLETLMTYCHSVMAAMGAISFIYYCDSVGKEMKALLELASVLEKTVWQEKEDVSRLINLIQNNRPIFRAARFFTIGRRTVFSIVNNLATFLLVLIQLD